MNKSFPERGERFRDCFTYIRKMAEDFPDFDNAHGAPSMMDMLPKPTAGHLPLLVTGGSQQSPDWSAQFADGWITYPRRDDPPTPIHLGFRSGIDPLRAYLKSLENIGINHVALNLRFNRADIDGTLHRLAEDLLPEFTPEES